MFFTETFEFLILLIKPIFILFNCINLMFSREELPEVLDLTEPVKESVEETDIKTLYYEVVGEEFDSTDKTYVFCYMIQFACCCIIGLVFGKFFGVFLGRVLP